MPNIQRLEMTQTFDDVLLVPQDSSILPKDVDLTTRQGVGKCSSNLRRGRMAERPS